LWQTAVFGRGFPQLSEIQYHAAILRVHRQSPCSQRRIFLMRNFILYSVKPTVYSADCLGLN
jgi:hypothetical protein